MNHAAEVARIMPMQNAKMGDKSWESVCSLTQFGWRFDRNVLKWKHIDLTYSPR